MVENQKKNLENMLPRLFDRFIDRANYNEQNDSVYEIRFEKDKVRIFDSYMKDRKDENSYFMYDLLLINITAIISLAPFIPLPHEVFRSYSHLALTPPILVAGFVALWRIGEYLINRKSRKSRNIYQQILIEE